MDVKNTRTKKDLYKNNPSVCPSLVKTLADVKTQIDYECFSKKLKSGTTYIDPQVNEICLIIAEIMLLPSQNQIKISNEVMWVGVIQEVYRSLTHEHIQLVIDNFKTVTNEIYNKKAYLRTALYNSIFECESHYINQMSSDWH